MCVLLDSGSRFRSFAVIGLMAFVVTTAQAQVIITQAPGAPYLAFEAESVNGLTSGDPTTGFAVVGVSEPFETAFGSTVLPEDTNATGEGGFAEPKALYDQEGGSDQDTAEYQLLFVEPGPYYLYLHYTMFERTDPSGYGNEDSLFIPRDFGSSPVGPRGNNNWWISTPAMGSSPKPNGGSAADAGGMEGQFHWWRVVENDGLEVAYDPPLNEVLDWSVATREAGFAADRWVFHQNPNLTPEDLDLWPIIDPPWPLPPEPLGDFNEDGLIDAEDFAILLSNTNTSVEAGLAGYFQGDFNLDTKVNLRDFVLFREAFAEFNSSGGEVATVPEPVARVLAGLAVTVVTVVRFHRRRATREQT